MKTTSFFLCFEIMVNVYGNFSYRKDMHVINYFTVWRSFFTFWSPGGESFTAGSAVTAIMC